ncbi:MAG: acyl-homoserine-lactone synthase [Paracoccaceae bacterium]
MLRYVYGNELDRMPQLRDSMFRDRAQQFAQRLNWDVCVDARGLERDEYDAMNPFYVIWERSDGSHGGSMRLLPTLGETMVNDHFSHLCGGVRIQSPLIWECTRFCLSQGVGRKVSAGLVLGAGEVMEQFHLSHFVGVFDERMQRIYRLLGVAPDVIGASGQGRTRIAVGLWEMRREAWPATLKTLGIQRATSRAWFDRSFGLVPLPVATGAPVSAMA